MSLVYGAPMLDDKQQVDESAGELTGSFLDHRDGMSLPYVVNYAVAGGEVHWSARIRLASRWHAVDATQDSTWSVPSGHLANLEDVRDAALSAMCAMDMPAALDAAMSARRIRRTRQFLCTGLMAACVYAGSLLWQAGAFAS